MKHKLGEIFDLQMGKTPDRHSPKFWNEGTEPWISIADLTKCNKYIKNTAEKITTTAVEESGIKIIPKNTVIMSFKLSIGKVAITPKEMYSNEAIMAFIDKGVLRIEPVYLYYLLMHKDWDSGTNKAVMGKTLNKATLSQMSVNIHEHSEQLEIIKVLDAASSLIEARKLQLAELDNLIKARFVEMFGDLANPACNWLQIKLADACEDPDDIKCGPFGTQLSKDEYGDSGVAVWEIPQINSHFATKPTHYLTEEKAKQLDAYSLRPGDIAMSRKGNVGKCAIFPARFEVGIIHSDVLRIRVDDGRVSPVFMMHQLHYSGAVQHQIELVSSGAIMAGINVTKLKQIFVHIPPLELQTQFAAFVEQVDKSKVVEAIYKIRTFFNITLNGGNRYDIRANEFKTDESAGS